MSDENNVAIVPEGYGLGSSSALMLPRANKGLAPLVIDMTDVYRIVARNEEIQRVTSATYPELVTDFNRGMIQLNRIIGLIELELGEAKHNLELDGSIALLERVEVYLAKKNIKSTADAREAAKIIDPDVQRSRRTVDALKAIESYINGLKSNLLNSYFAAQHVSGISSKDPYLNKTAGEYNGK
jgi:hypothetical protein